MTKNQNEPFREKIHRIIFEADSKIGQLFDIILITAIALSVIIVMLDSVESLHDRYGDIFYYMEWFFTILFTVEYLIRIYAVQKPSSYIFSFFGLIDLIAVLPTYLSILFPGYHYLLVIRVLRVLRVFRILKLITFIGQAQMLKEALRSSRHKIIVFLFTVLSSVIVLGSLMYIIEGAKSGFTSIPKSIYWAIVTLTTVGYGDISPQTELGQMLAAVIMILGYGIIAVPTGIVTVELSKVEHRIANTKVCSSCSEDIHDNDALFCKRCGNKL
ncbi:MAG: ion transporter [Calditrichaeota bacterium]|nr:MAG: ion transporter [Calditrichota bacterium]